MIEVPKASDIGHYPIVFGHQRLAVPNNHSVKIPQRL